MDRYDTIVIGSGAGGLAAAVALAQVGQKVLVCEQHEVPGGWMHSFTMDGYRFNTGVHYIGELGEGERLRKIYEGLGVADDLAFMELNPEGYDHLIFGDRQFDIPKGKQEYIRRLKEHFPNESTGIDQLFQKIEDVFWVLLKMVDEEWLSILKRPAALPWFARSGGALIDYYVKDGLLRAILKGQSAAHGMPPNKVSAAIHAAIIKHYMEGAYHPLGGGMAISRAFVRALKRAGGELRLETGAKKILVEGKKVVGVGLQNGERIYASHVISNADPYQTFYQLIGANNLSIQLKRKLKRTSYSTSCLSLYLVVDCDLKSLGIDSGNYYLHSNQDLDRVFEQGMTDHARYAGPDFLFLTATSLKDPGKLRSGRHQLEVFSFVGYDAFSKWEKQRSGDRDWEYQQLKSQIIKHMLDRLEQYFPSLKDSIVFQDLGTPLTNAFYIRAHKGNIYGIDKGIWQAGPLGFRARTEFKNLYLCGASTMAHGVAYSTNSGLTAASKILKCRPKDLLQPTGQELRVYQCEDRSTWPTHLHRLKSVEMG